MLLSLDALGVTARIRVQYLRASKIHLKESDMDMEANGITSDDKLFAALAYLFSPIVPLLLLVIEDKKERPFIRAHNAQALAAGIVITILTVGTIGCGSVIWIVMLYWAYKAYQGEYIEIPVITDFVKNQGWA